MPKTCACHGCTNRSSRLSNVSFHRFPPSDPDLLLKWKISIWREDFQPTANHSVCSDHFLSKDYQHGLHPRDGPKGTCYKLLAKAVPTVITETEPIRRPRKPKKHPKPILLIKAQCRDNNNADEKVAFQPPEVFNRNDGSAASLCIQQLKSEVTAQSLRVHSPNLESRNLVTDELRVTALSGVVTQEAKNSDKHRTFRTPEVFDGNDGSADLCIQQIKSEVTAQSLRVHSPNPESRNLVTDELRVTALSGVVTQEAKNSDKHRTFRTPEVFDGNDGSADLCIQQIKSEVTAQSLRVHSPNPESRNLVTDELRVTALSGVVTQEPKNSDKHQLFRPPKVIDGNDGSAGYFQIQQQKSEVTAQSLRLYPSNPESRNLVTDELCVTGHSDVVTQEPNNGDKCRSKVAVHKVMIGRASVENMERELKETKFRLRESRKEVETLKLKLKRRDDDLSKILKEMEEQQMISRQVIINHSACSGHVLREECLQGVNLTEYEKELLADAREAHQQQEQKSRRKQTLPMKRQCPDDEGVDSAALQPLKKVNGSDDKCTASPQVQRQESEVTEEKPQVHVHTHVTNTEAQKPCLGEQRLNELHVHVHLKSSTKNRK